MNQNIQAWKDHPVFVGFDWAGDHHDIVAVDRDGQIVLNERIEDTEKGWKKLLDALRVYGSPPVAIETRSGATVERLLDAGLLVYPINPKAAKRYRERIAPSGTKTDFVDALSMAMALRSDGHGWRQLLADDPLTIELRLLCRDEMALTEQRTAFICRLRAALKEYYPTALKAFDDWKAPSALKFLEQFPTPEALASAGKTKWNNFLHANKLARPGKYEERLDLFAKAESFTGSQAAINAKSMTVAAIVAQLRTIQKHLGLFRERIEKLYARHPDHDIFGSLPGAGEKTTSRLLSEFGDDRGRFDTFEALQCHAGTAPVTVKSGKHKSVKIRRACNKTLRFAVHHWANLSRKKCQWAETYYQKKRKEGQSHASALRCLGQRWLKILWKMWQEKERYDAERHYRNQVRHGSWVIALNEGKNAG